MVLSYIIVGGVMLYLYRTYERPPLEPKYDTSFRRHDGSQPLVDSTPGRENVEWEACTTLHRSRPWSGHCTQSKHTPNIFQALEQSK